MGNSNNKNSVALQLVHKEVILHYAYKIKLKIGYTTKFPHYYEGLKLWDANIVLARFIILNSELFKGKVALELASGTGIAGITLQKWTSIKNVTMSDLSDEVVSNIRHNSKNNGV